MQTSFNEEQIQDAHHLLEQTLYELKRVIVGHHHVLERLLIAVICHGHVLVEGPPGLAKTLMLRTLSHILQVSFKRIQFTPDLLPADLIGTRVYHPGQGSFHTEQGPLFAHFVLADEINRAPAKVQSALLEAMQEQQVTIGRETFPLNQPFLVMATQNPIESEGTYPLPEAQLDRFLFKLLVDYPTPDEEFVILERVTADALPTPKALLSPERIQALSTLLPQVFMEATLMTGIVKLVQATRTAYPDLIQYGASPRGALAIANAAKGLALLSGRSYVLPEDIQAVYPDCLRHRLVLSYEALAQNVSVEDILTTMLTFEPPVT